MATVCWLAISASTGRASVYLDAANDLFAGANAPQLDIASVVVSNDTANLHFTINVLGNPVLTNWGSYAIAFVTGPGGATNGNASGAAICQTSGINYWLTCLGWGNQELCKFNTNTLAWTTNSAGLVFANSSNSVALTVAYANLGLSAGASFQFDVYTFSGTGGAVDDLANPNVASSWWNIPYTNNLVDTYTISSPPGPASGTLSLRVLEDTNTVIWKNPGKGWVSYNWSWPSGYTASEYGMINLLYSRWDWSSIETNENQYNWSQIDTGISQAQANGVQFAFGIMTTDWTDAATPQWVFNDGAAYYTVSGVPIPYWTNNPVFFSKLDAFIQALGQRYNGNANIAFIDVRDFGQWGEGHLGEIDVSDSKQTIVYPSITQLETNYYQPYFNAFPNTQLVIPWGTTSYDRSGAYAWAVQQGAGMRRDGVPNCLATTNEIAQASGYGPGVIEYCDDYDWSVTNGEWVNTNVCSIILAEKASYSQISWDSDFFATFSNSMASIENKMGYHFVLTNVTIPAWLSSISGNAITMNWVNRGVSYLYQPCSVAMALLDGANTVIGKSWLAGVSPRTKWGPGPIAVSSSMSFGSVPAGSYQLAVGLFTSTNQVNPNFMIGNSSRTPTGWYVITNVQLFDIAPPATNPTSLTPVYSGGALNISWPADHIGWTLEAQTNSTYVGISSNWVSIANSFTTNQIAFPVNQSTQTVFFRLKY